MAILNLQVGAKKKVEVYGEFLTQQLAGHPLTGGKVGTAFVEAQKALLDHFEEMKKIERELGQSEGRGNWMSMDVYREVKLFQTMLLSRMGYNRKNELYQRVFPKGFGVILPMKLESKFEWLKSAASELSKEGEKFSDLVTMLGDLAGKIEAVVGEAVELAEKRKAMKADTGRLESIWDREYRQAFYELCQTFLDEKYMVDAFFKRKESVRKNKKAAEEPASMAPESEDAV